MTWKSADVCASVTGTIRHGHAGARDHTQLAWKALLECATGEEHEEGRCARGAPSRVHAHGLVEEADHAKQEDHFKA